MALPTITYDRDGANTDASTVQAVMTKLHTMLLSKGWTIEYADASAVGSGSSGSPAWDTTPASNTDAGTVVYQMPANDHDTPWYIKITAKWGSAPADDWCFTFAQAGTGHSSGTLSGGGSGVTRSVSNGDVTSLGHEMAVSEDGLFILLDGSTSSSVFLLIERVRDADGTVSDEVFIMVKNNTSSASIAWAFYSAATGEDTTSDIAVIGRVVSNWTTLSGAGSLLSADGASSALVGPYPTRRANLGAPPRLACLVSTYDASLDSNIQLNVDGGAKTYHVTTNSQSHSYLAVATE